MYFVFAHWISPSLKCVEWVRVLVCYGVCVVCGLVSGNTNMHHTFTLWHANRHDGSCLEHYDEDLMASS